jgi:hypothetical protein
MKRVGLLILVAAIASTAAPAAPTATATSKSVEQFDGCFAAAQERASLPWSYVPKPHGGTFSNFGAADAKSVYFLAVSDHGATRELRLEAAETVSSTDARVARAVNQCA